MATDLHRSSRFGITRKHIPKRPQVARRGLGLFLCLTLSRRLVKVSLKGRRFGRWTVLRSAGRNKWHQAMWICRCDCGTRKRVVGWTLTSDKWKTRSCGCAKSDACRNSHRMKLKRGTRFGRLIVIRRSKVTGRTYWHCLCDCGNRTVTCGVLLRNGTVKSCGCLKKGPTSQGWKHGGCAIYRPEYNSWVGMVNRCYDPKNINYESYGGRGVKVCDRWMGRAGFLTFIDDMGRRPEAKTLDRKNVMGNYEPDNCRWADAKTQIENQRRWMTPEQLEALKKQAAEETSEDFYGSEHPY